MVELIYVNVVNINIYQDSTEPLNTFFINNKESYYNGKAVYVEMGLIVENTLFSGNSTDDDGGVIYVRHKANVDHCLFESNKTEGFNRYIHIMVVILVSKTI